MSNEKWRDIQSSWRMNIDCIIPKLPDDYLDNCFK